MMLSDAIQRRVLLLDGAMGTMIQTFRLDEEDFRGTLLCDVAGQMKGNNDVLTLTRPDVILDIHRSYLEAGADIITTNTFNAQRISQADYGCGHLVARMNAEAVRLARKATAEYSSPEHPRYVIATVGPTNKTCSMSPDVNNPAARAVSFDEMAEAYVEQMDTLLRSGVDAILLETIFDTLNAKAGIYAFEQAVFRTGVSVPLMLSVTVNDQYGRLLSGQTLEAFLISVQHAPVFSVGLNCSFGAAEMLPCLRRLAEQAPYYITAHPNAGLPNALGAYDQTPRMMVDAMRPFVEERLVNVIGGCCGTTPEHIAALHSLLCETSDHNVCLSSKLHVPAAGGKCCSSSCHAYLPDTLRLSGLEPLVLTPEVGFINVGERCNVAGSRKFLRLISEGSYDEALAIARRQAEDGALVLDINMDDGLLDARREMTTFLNLIGSEPDICRVPLMIDSSRWDVIEAGLKCVQGRCIVNSLSLKEGEALFVERARRVRELGAALVVMAFDEQGQADTLERRIAICERAYRILTQEVGMPPSDIIFDPNVLAIATGMPEHDGYALDFIRATDWIHRHLPHAHVSGGVSNLSFAFRGNNYLREAMHSVFLYHARRYGMDMAIVNPSSRVSYADIPAELLEVIEEVILRPSPSATERLIAMAGSLMLPASEKTSSDVSSASSLPPVDEDASARIVKAILRGGSATLESDLRMALDDLGSPVAVIEGPLMDGMNRVGELFGEGKMFLPQVVKAARTMKQAVAFLQPWMDGQRADVGSAGRVLLATVKGDVHDIGKNIVGMVMACNGYEIIDLGVMVPAEEIVSKACELHPDVIGLSGLITPSLEEMVRVVGQLRSAGIDVPVMIGGATTSEVHTALRIAPVYGGPVVWVRDASHNAPVAQRFLHPQQGNDARRELQERQAQLRETYQREQSLRSLAEARSNKLSLFPEQK